MVDWNRTREFAARMINQYGRPITMINDQGPDEQDKPLRGPKEPIKETVMGVFVRPSGYIKLGESFYMEQGMWPEAEKIALVLPSLTHDYATFTRVLDSDNKGYKIFKVEELRPGPVPILLYVGLKQ